MVIGDYAVPVQLNASEVAFRFSKILLTKELISNETTFRTVLIHFGSFKKELLASENLADAGVLDGSIISLI